MWLWGANPWAHSSDLPTPGDSTPTVLARRHWSGHQALGASCQTTADGGLPSSHRPEDLARSSHRTQKKKKKKNYWLSLRHHTTTVVYDSPNLSIWPLFVVNRFLWLPADSSQMTSSSWTLAWTSISGMARAAARMNVSRSDVSRELSTV